jgi:hypothetical protein
MKDLDFYEPDWLYVMVYFFGCKCPEEYKCFWKHYKGLYDGL